MRPTLLLLSFILLFSQCKKDPVPQLDLAGKLVGTYSVVKLMGTVNGQPYVVIQPYVVGRVDVKRAGADSSQIDVWSFTLMDGQHNPVSQQDLDNALKIPPFSTRQPNVMPVMTVS